MPPERPTMHCLSFSPRILPLSECMNSARLIVLQLFVFWLASPGTVQSADPDPAKHWAFVPVADPKPPAVIDATWARSPVDRFVLAKLEAAGLRPAPQADKRALIRRATFDLTGLPPTPAEIDAFLADKSAGAFAAVVDRLLSSPAYGEKWGRHWLDVARYADSNGLDENIAHGNAWRYRDYVVASFNADKPYRDFIREQIAGDLLPTADPEARRERLTALGFLAIGPKVLAEVDERKMDLDIVDEQVDTLGRTFLGLTVGCARCHDHKFDPLTLEDYTALAGIFTSTRTMDSFTKIARWHENPIPTPAEAEQKAAHDAVVAKLKDKVKLLTGKTDESSKKQLAEATAELTKREKAAPDMSSAMGVVEGKAADTPVLTRGNHLKPGKPIPRQFPVVLAGEKQSPIPTDRSGRLELADWLTKPNHPLTARVMVNRIWRWHFGQGLVRSVDNFGMLGDKPTHPELLDWLATQFVRNKWSMKETHRQLMLSATYQMGAAPDSAAMATDPDGRLLWRFPPRRLEAEEMRDSLLAVSGRLDRKRGGPAITHVKNREFLFDHTSKDGTTYESRRRSLYLPVVRNHLYDVFQLFDAPNATVMSGDRPTTTVATQALFWMNSPLVTESAAALATTLLSTKDLDDSGRVRTLYLTAYGRPSTPSEESRMTNAAARFEASAVGKDAATRRAKAWAIVCQVVLAANEFVYVN